jgi:four helix bundle protein
MDGYEWMAELRRGRTTSWRGGLAQLGRQMYAAALSAFTWIVNGLDTALGLLFSREKPEDSRLLAHALERAICPTPWMEARVLMKEIHLATRAAPKGALTEMGSELRRYAISVCAAMARAGASKQPAESERQVDAALADLASIQCLVSPAWELGLIGESDSYDLHCAVSELIRRLEREREERLLRELVARDSAPAVLQLVHREPDPGAA